MQLVAHLITLAFSIRFVLCDYIAIDLDGKRKEEQEEESAAAPPIASSVLRLNSQIFKGNVLQHNFYVKRWVVLYCLPWFPPCQTFQKAYNQVSQEQQQARNTDLLFSNVRFAQVDCATDKVLCNDMNVGMMPLVAVYENQHEAARTVWGQNSDPIELLNSFLAKRLAKAVVSAKKTQPQSAWVSVFVRKCFTWFETSLLGRMWFGIDRDVRTFIGTLFIAITVWSLLHRFLQPPGIQRAASAEEKCMTSMPQYVLLSPGSQRDDLASSRKQADDVGLFIGSSVSTSRQAEDVGLFIGSSVSTSKQAEDVGLFIGASVSTEKLHSRTHSEQPSHVSDSIIL